MATLLKDLLKDELLLYRRLTRLLYRQDPRNCLVLFFLVMYHKSESVPIPEDDLNDLVVNISHVLEQQEGSALFYSAVLLQVLYLSQPLTTHSLCIEAQVLPLLFQRLNQLSC